MRVFRQVLPADSTRDPMSMVDLFGETDARLPINASWVRISTRGASHKHQHHDTEVWFITSGSGRLCVDVDGSVRTETLTAGDAVVLPPFTAHQVHNEDGAEPLCFLTVYWEDFDAALRVVEARASVQHRPRAIVTAAPPTTNGDLHLGHLSGPYLAADVLARYMRLRGVDAHFTCGSDDHQSYIEWLGQRTETPSEAIAERYSLAVQATLRAIGTEPAVYLRSGVRPDHQSRVRQMLHRLVSGGHASVQPVEAPFCPVTGRYLYEPYLLGRCPCCGSECAGNSCEDCGLPHDPLETVNAVSVLSGAAPVRREVRQIVFPLERYRPQIAEFVRMTNLPDRLRIVGEQMLAARLPDVPLTYPSNLGVSVGIEGFDDQRIWAWFDMWVNYVTQLQDLAQQAGWNARDDFSGQPGDLEIVQFFGCDNGWYHVVLYPALGYAAFGHIPDLRYVTNEFLLLEGRKFSTSRGHAIWGRDALRRWPADVLRFYLALVRPESSKTNFNPEDLTAFAQRELAGAWQGWLDHVNRRVRRHFGGRAPVAGLWTGSQTAFLGELGSALDELAECYEIRTFSLATAARRLMELVRRARVFSEGDARWDDAPESGDTVRAGVALELAAARALAMGTAPLMPGFAARLASNLGLSGAAGCGTWIRKVEFVPPGAVVALEADYFAAPSYPSLHTVA